MSAEATLVYAHSCPNIMCRCFPPWEFQARPEIQTLMRADNGLQALADAWTAQVCREQAECHHWWYRSAYAPPDHCTKCGLEEDHG